MQSYHHIITAKFIKELARIARDCDIPDEKLDDDELFEEVLETLYRNEPERKISLSNQASIEEGQVFLRTSIAHNGWQGTISIAAIMVIARIPNTAVAYQFLLEELDGARQGNEYAQETARRSGISPHEYIGALQHCQPEVDGPDGPQQLLVALSFQLADDQALMAKFRCDVGRAIQEHYNLGDCSGKFE